MTMTMKDIESAKRDAALARVARGEGNFCEEITAHTRQWIMRQRRGKQFTGQEACAEAVEAYPPREPRVTGAPMRAFAKEGLIVKVGRSTTGSHKREQTIWTRQA
jgi:hypothetical protein